jgi:hypothetical protein
VAAAGAAVRRAVRKDCAVLSDFARRAFDAYLKLVEIAGIVDGTPNA